MMTNRMVNNRIQKLFELESQKREIESKIEEIKKELQSDMDDKGVVNIDTGKFIVRLTPVTQSRMDTKKFKNDYLELFNLYSTESSYRRFSYSVH